MAYAARRGYEVSHIYVDEGASGLDFGRVALQQMLADARAGEIERILMTDLARLGRQLDKVIEIEETLHSLGVEVIYIHAIFGNDSMAAFLQGMHAYMEDILSAIPGGEQN